MTPGERPHRLPGEGRPKAADVEATVTENYGRHNEAVDRLECLQDWARKQQKVK